MNVRYSYLFYLNSKSTCFYCNKFGYILKFFIDKIVLGLF